MLKSILHSITLAVALFALSPGASAQEAGSEAPAASDRSATGGAQTLEDILARQRGEDVPREEGDASSGSSTEGALATQGTASDAAFWRAVKQGEGETFTVSIPDKNAARLVQSEGEDWLAFRSGPLLKYTGWAIGGVLLLLLLFRIIRGRVMIDGGYSGIKIERFKFIERFGHWLLGVSFIILAITGLSSLAGREVLVPLFDSMRAGMYAGEVEPIGKAVFAEWAEIAKWLHNNVSWAFMAGLILVFVMWVLSNIPTWTDVKWALRAGGLFSAHSHPPARKFNAGQKIFFWLVIILGVSVSASGMSLLFPYEFPLFAETFGTLNAASESVGEPLTLSEGLTPVQEMQYAQTWHTIIGVAMIVVIIAHMYIGSIGMQGAFSAMGSGKVDLNWAREHHSLWVKKLARKGKLPAEADSANQAHDGMTPAE